MQERTGATTDGREHILPLLPHLRAYARSLSGGDVHAADGLVQDTVLLALRAWDRFTPGTNLRAWLFCILHNRSHTVRNRKRLSAEVGVGDIELHGSVPAVQERRADLRHFDLMAGPEAVAGKVGGLYAPAHELADVPDTPRRAFIAREDVSVPLAGVAGILTYVGATAAALGSSPPAGRWRWPWPPSRRVALRLATPVP